MKDFTIRKYTHRTRQVPWASVSYNGKMIATMAEEYLEGFLAEMKICQMGWPGKVADGYLTFNIYLLGVRDYAKSFVIGYSEDGKDLTGDGRNYFANEDAAVLSATPMKPEAKKIVNLNEVFDLCGEKFVFTKDRGHVVMKKSEEAL